jgi:pyrimidine-nucleoside phosphorylase
MVRTQGGNPKVVKDLSLLPQAKHKIEANAPISGIVQRIDTYRIGMLSVELGAGRKTTSDAVDPAVGFEIYKKIGDEVKQGEGLATVHANDESKGVRVAGELAGCFEMGAEATTRPGLIIKRIT